MARELSTNICPLGTPNVRGEWTSSVPGDVLARGVDNCSATLYTAVPGSRSITFLIMSGGHGASQTVVITVVAAGSTDPAPGSFDPNYKLRAGRFDCHLNGSPTGYAFTVDLTSPSTYSVPTSTSGALGNGPTGTYTVDATTGRMTFANGPLSTGSSAAGRPQ